MTNIKHHRNTRPTRTLHLVDLENLASTAHVSEATAHQAAAQYLLASEYTSGDLLVVASSHRNGLAARLAFPGATVRWRSGRNGADLALADAYSEFDPSRFDRLVLGSGDGIFAGLVATARWSGLNVTVVSHRRNTSAALRAAATTVTLLGEAA